MEIRKIYLKYTKQGKRLGVEWARTLAHEDGAKGFEEHPAEFHPDWGDGWNDMNLCAYRALNAYPELTREQKPLTIENFKLAQSNHDLWHPDVSSGFPRVVLQAVHFKDVEDERFVCFAGVWQPTGVWSPEITFKTGWFSLRRGARPKEIKEMSSVLMHLDDIDDRTNKLITETLAFLDGKRRQTQLQFPEGDPAASYVKRNPDTGETEIHITQQHQEALGELALDLKQA